MVMMMMTLSMSHWYLAVNASVLFVSYMMMVLRMTMMTTKMTVMTMMMTVITMMRVRMTSVSRNHSYLAVWMQTSAGGPGQSVAHYLTRLLVPAPPPGEAGSSPHGPQGARAPGKASKAYRTLAL